MLSPGLSGEDPRPQEGNPSTRAIESGRNLKPEAGFGTKLGSIHSQISLPLPDILFLEVLSMDLPIGLSF